MPGSPTAHQDADCCGRPIPNLQVHFLGSLPGQEAASSLDNSGSCLSLTTAPDFQESGSRAPGAACVQSPPHTQASEAAWPCSTSEACATRPTSHAVIAHPSNHNNLASLPTLPQPYKLPHSISAQEDRLPHLFLPMNHCYSLTSCTGKGPSSSIA